MKDDCPPTRQEAEADLQEAAIIATAKAHAERLWFSKLSDVADEIEYGADDWRRPPAGKARMREIVKELNDLIDEAAEYL